MPRVEEDVSSQAEAVDVAQSRATEIAWLETHPEQAAELTGHWLAIDGDELVSHGPDLDAVLRLAVAAGHTHPFITKVSDGTTTFVF